MEGTSWNQRLRGSLNARLLLFFLLLTAALTLRCARLDHRPMHNDEAVNAVKFGRLLETHAYRYDPNEHHGPSLYYATVPTVRLAGSATYESLTEGQLRFVTVLFSL